MKGFDQGFQRDKSAIQEDFKRTMEDMRRAFNGKKNRSDTQVWLKGTVLKTVRSLTRRVGSNPTRSFSEKYSRGLRGPSATGIGG